jgi:hypothetical protein
MVLVGFEVEDSVKKAILKKSKASGLTLSEYLRRIVAQDLKLEYGVEYMTRQEVEELIDLKLLKIGFKAEVKTPEPQEPPTEATDLKEDLNIEDAKIQKAIYFIAKNLKRNNEPATYGVYKLLGINNDKKLKDLFGQLLKEYGIETKATTKSGIGCRVYKKEDYQPFYNLLTDKNRENFDQDII